MNNIIRGDILTREIGSSGLPNAIAKLDSALSHLETVWQNTHFGLRDKLNAGQQRFEQQIQSLRVQSAHWKAENEKLVTQLVHQHNFEQRLQKAEQELAFQRQQAKTFQEKAESWKEEARRSEEARVAALHNAGSVQVKNIAQEISKCLDETIEQLKEVIVSRNPKPENLKIAEGQV